MSDYSDFISWLRLSPLHLAAKAANALKEQSERIAELEAALKLFTEIDNYPDNVMMERIRNARKALEKGDE